MNTTNTTEARDEIEEYRNAAFIFERVYNELRHAQKLTWVIERDMRLAAREYSGAKLQALANEAATLAFETSLAIRDARSWSYHVRLETKRRKSKECNDE